MIPKLEAAGGSASEWARGPRVCNLQIPVAAGLQPAEWAGFKPAPTIKCRSRLVVIADWAWWW